MGLFSKLFKKKETIATNVTDNTSFESPECQSLWDLKVYMDAILSQNCYISKSEYRTKLLDGKKTAKSQALQHGITPCCNLLYEGILIITA